MFLPFDPSVKLPPYEPNVPEPTTRADFLQCMNTHTHMHGHTQTHTGSDITSFLSSDWVPITLDDRTAQKLLWISEGGAKVARTSEAVCPYPTRPERYDHSPQVATPSPSVMSPRVPLLMLTAAANS